MLPWHEIVLCLLLALSQMTVDTPDHVFGVDCWEDEVVVLVVSDPYDSTDATFGCVPADNLPVSGNRP